MLLRYTCLDLPVRMARRVIRQSWTGTSVFPTTSLTFDNCSSLGFVTWSPPLRSLDSTSSIPRRSLTRFRSICHCSDTADIVFVLSVVGSRHGISSDCKVLSSAGGAYSITDQKLSVCPSVDQCSKARGWASPARPHASLTVLPAKRHRPSAACALTPSIP